MLFGNPGREKQSETWKQLWVVVVVVGGGVGCAGSWLFPVVWLCWSPQSPSRCCRGYTLQKRGTGKTWRVAQLLAQIGARRPQALAQEVSPLPPGLDSRAPLCRVGALGSILHTHTTPRRSPQDGCPLLNPRVR